MKLVLLIASFSLLGCIPEEDCHTTDEVVRYRTETTEFYTISVPVYREVCK